MEVKPPLTGKIFDIQGFSVHDGPGARTLVFLKGCPLHCFWCSNPEGIGFNDDLFHYASRCTTCGDCVPACPHHAISLPDGNHSLQRDACASCREFPCVEACNNKALQRCGRDISVEELFEVINRDRQFWGAGGGVTLSGGEPLAQPDFLAEFLKKCYNAYIHTAVETSGHVPWRNFEQVLPFLDWIFVDLKHPYPDRHTKGTGTGNELILENIRRLNDLFPGQIIFRMPLVPGFNDQPSSLSAIAGIVRMTKWKTVNLLPLHHLGANKYLRIGKSDATRLIPVPTEDQLLTAKSILESAGVECHIGSNTWF